jgi:hypothetical protein
MHRKLKCHFLLVFVILSAALGFSQSLKGRSSDIKKKTNRIRSSLKYHISNNLVLLDGANYSLTILSEVHKSSSPILSTSDSTIAVENNSLDYKNLNEGLIFRHTRGRPENKENSVTKEYLIANFILNYSLEYIVFAFSIQHLLHSNLHKTQFSTELNLFKNPSP